MTDLEALKFMREQFMTQRSREFTHSTIQKYNEAISMIDKAITDLELAELQNIAKICDQEPGERSERT